jgi:hypothetical protein
LSRSRLLLCTSAAAAALALGTPARADDRVDTYRAAVARGQAAFDDGRFAIARAEFRAAYEIHAEPVLLFNIASTYRREGELERALELYREFLSRAPNHARADLARQTLRELEDEIALRESAPAPELVPETEAPEPPGLAPAFLAGDHGDDDRPRRASNPLRWASLALGAGGAIAGGLAVYAARDARRAESALEALGEGDEWGNEQQALYDDGVEARRNVLLFSAASAALVTTGVVLYVVGERRRDRETTTVTVVPEDGGAVVGLSGRF